MEFMHLMEGTVGQFHVADKHTDYMIPSELFDETIKAFGHCEDASKLLLLRVGLFSIKTNISIQFEFS